MVDSGDDDKERARKRAEEKADAARQLAEQQMRTEEKEMAQKAKEDRSAKRNAFREAGYRQSDPNLFNISEEEIRKREQQLTVRLLRTLCRSPGLFARRSAKLHLRHARSSLRQCRSRIQS